MANTKQGKVFEQNWQDSYKYSDHYYMRLKDTAKWLQGSGSSFTPSNLCDAIQHTMPFLWLLELKSTKDASISFNPYIEGKSSPEEKPKNTTTNVMIKASQVKGLRQAVKHQGVIAGFVVNYREQKLKTKTKDNEVFFIHINDFWNFAVETGKSSVSREDARSIGVRIESKKLKVNYRYKINEFVDESIKKYISKGIIDKKIST
ncbi:hypothetical protein BRE01_60160 [Brevibacillus reuszeri]|uniref:Uncharacterized protein n=1 Tax=Brevibacillus reuszeri TaxID=54915 RepID=A0A0K9YNE1_9BACL|nr:hypothetical protein [Brevibacillus reuszeri]KNB70234.1 hypothetical protein ADS79_14805 [Brevibacillus reuszeri]MED1859191.1 hypothetical protein [Brevibacillus reuszeri]GED72314.1 hypothetical protein BRE01_60160 [Brevibacillus reuszeri]